MGGADGLEKKLNKQDVAEVLAKPYSQELLTTPTTGRGNVPTPCVRLGAPPAGLTSAASAASRRGGKPGVTSAEPVRAERGQSDTDGVPDEYLHGNLMPAMEPDQFAEWEAGVRALDHQMVKITVEPTWAKLLDFETTLPKAVEDLILERQGA